MVTPDEHDLERGARFVEKLLAEDPAKLDVATDDEVVAMMRAANVPEVEPESAEEMLARGERRARERAAKGKPRGPEPVQAVAPYAEHPEPARVTRMPTRRAAWTAGAIAAAAVVTVAAIEGPALLGRNEPAPPDHPREPLSPEEQQAARIATLRNEARAACDAKDWKACASKLDDAKALDPAGEIDPRVQGMRDAIAAATTPPEPSVVPEKRLVPDKPPR